MAVDAWRSSESVRPALYYPYIHIRSEHWLKATLLCVPCVKRIVPTEYTPEDKPNFIKYTEIEGRQGPLLQAVGSGSGAALHAQRRLTTKVMENLDVITALYHRSKAPRRDRYWIHDQKLNSLLRGHLEEHGLAWESRDPHGQGTRNWLALHPTLGSALMTIIGLSIAKSEELDVITPSRRFHETLLATEERAVFDRLIKGTRTTRVPLVQARHDLSEMVISVVANLQALPPEAIPDLQQSDELMAFQRLIRQTAAMVNREDGIRDYRREIEQQAQGLVDAWRNSKKSVPRALRQSVFEQGLRVGAAWLTRGGPKTLAVGAGLAIAIVGHKVRQARKTEVNDPLRYLTQVSNAADNGMRLSFPLGLER